MGIRTPIPKLAPQQLGVGVHGGSEAKNHTARAFVASASPFHTIVKLDSKNEFNAILRDSIFEAVSTNFSEIWQYALAPYESP